MIDGGLFITGTDTEVGKTWVSCALLDALHHAGVSAFGLKPVAAGAQRIDGALRNDDAQALMLHSSPTIAYEAVNPVLLQGAVAPHIAAHWEQRELSLAELADHCRHQLQARTGIALVEGAGGWRVPLNARECLSDLAIALALPVVMVVPIRLGCLNHAMLTAEAIARDGLPLVGWVANMVRSEYVPSDMLIETLAQRLGAPCLAQIPLYSGDYSPSLSNLPSPSVPYVDLPGLLAAAGAMRNQY